MAIQDFNSGVTRIVNIVLTPFESFQPIWPLAIVSLVMGIFMLLIFRHTSNQKEIRKTKDRIKGHLIEIRLFKDNLRVLLSAQKKILLYNLKYMALAVKPMLFMILPVGIALIQMNDWFGLRPLRPGESAVVAVSVSHEKAADLSDVAVEVDQGLTIETPALRMADADEVDWKIRADAPGEHLVTVRASGYTFHKQVVVSESPLVRVSSVRVAATTLWDPFFNPGEEPLPANPLVKRIEVGYPHRLIEILGWKFHWLLVFFVLSIVSGLAFKRFFKVEI